MCWLMVSPHSVILYCDVSLIYQRGFRSTTTDVLAVPLHYKQQNIFLTPLKDILLYQNLWNKYTKSCWRQPYIGSKNTFCQHIQQHSVFNNTFLLFFRWPFITYMAVFVIAQLSLTTFPTIFLIQKQVCSALQYNPGYYILVQLINVNCLHQY